MPLAACCRRQLVIESEKYQCAKNDKDACIHVGNPVSSSSNLFGKSLIKRRIFAIESDMFHFLSVIYHIKKTSHLRTLALVGGALTTFPLN